MVEDVVAFDEQLGAYAFKEGAEGSGVAHVVLVNGGPANCVATDEEWTTGGECITVEASGSQ